jgi:hypothetical protein
MIHDQQQMLQIVIYTSRTLIVRTTIELHINRTRNRNETIALFIVCSVAKWRASRDCSQYCDAERFWHKGWNLLDSSCELFSWFVRFLVIIAFAIKEKMTYLLFLTLQLF